MHNAHFTPQTCASGLQWSWEIEKSEKHPVKERIDSGSVCDLCDPGPEHKNELINSRHQSPSWDLK